MTSILFLIGRIYRNQSKCNNLKNKKNLHQILIIFLKNEPHSFCISEIVDYE